MGEIAERMAVMCDQLELLTGDAYCWHVDAKGSYHLRKAEGLNYVLFDPTTATVWGGAAWGPLSCAVRYHRLNDARRVLNSWRDYAWRAPPTPDLEAVIALRVIEGRARLSAAD